MRKLRRYFGLTGPERRLLIRSALILGMMRLALKLLPFRSLVRFLDQMTRDPRGQREPTAWAPDRLTWAVTVVAPYVLGARPCLAQALTVQLLLRRRGHPARLCFGVARGAWGEMLAHAWVESSGQVMIGGTASELQRFTPLLALDEKSA
jgi:hypothetical protein